jgi:hypothetical protein
MTIDRLVSAALVRNLDQPAAAGAVPHDLQTARLDGSGH